MSPLGLLWFFTTPAYPNSSAMSSFHLPALLRTHQQERVEPFPFVARPPCAYPYHAGWVGQGYASPLRALDRPATGMVDGGATDGSDGKGLETNRIAPSIGIWGHAVLVRPVADIRRDLLPFASPRTQAAPPSTYP